MPVEWQPNPGFPGELLAELRPELHALGERIAETTVQNTTIHRYPRGKGPSANVTATPTGIVVGRMEPWAAIDEYGGTGLAPSRALRRAVSQAGLLLEEL